MELLKNNVSMGPGMAANSGRDLRLPTSSNKQRRGGGKSELDPRGSRHQHTILGVIPRSYVIAETAIIHSKLLHEDRIHGISIMAY